MRGALLACAKCLPGFVGIVPDSFDESPSCSSLSMTFVFAGCLLGSDDIARQLYLGSDDIARQLYLGSDEIARQLYLGSDDIAVHFFGRLHLGFAGIARQPIVSESTNSNQRVKCPTTSSQTLKSHLVSTQELAAVSRPSSRVQPAASLRRVCSPHYRTVKRLICEASTFEEAEVKCCRRTCLFSSLISRGKVNKRSS